LACSLYPSVPCPAALPLSLPCTPGMLRHAELGTRAVCLIPIRCERITSTLPCPTSSSPAAVAPGLPCKIPARTAPQVCTAPTLRTLPSCPEIDLVAGERPDPPHLPTRTPVRMYTGVIVTCVIKTCILRHLRGDQYRKDTGRGTARRVEPGIGPSHDLRRDQRRLRARVLVR
jgi:hypothetical protein